MLLNGHHFHAVGEYQSPEAQLFFQEARNDGPGHGAGYIVRLDFGKENVAGHNGGHPRLDTAAEGHQFRFLQLLQSLVDPGQAQMGVHIGVAMAGKMLAAAENARVFIGQDGGSAQFRRLFRVITEAADTDDRIFRIGVHIQHGSHIEIGSQALQLPDGNFRGSPGGFRIAYSGYRHGAGHRHRILRQAGYQSALLVDDDEGGITGDLQDQCLDFPAEAAHLLRAFDVAQKQDHIADPVFPDQLPEFFGEGCAVEAEDQLLAQHLLDCHFHIRSPLSGYLDKFSLFGKL